MDNICHTLVGAALGEAGLKYRTRFGMVTLAIAANLPDIDAGVILTSGTDKAYGGYTHMELAFLASAWVMAQAR